MTVDAADQQGPHELDPAGPGLPALLEKLTGQRPTSVTIDPPQHKPWMAVFVPGTPRPQGSKRPFRNPHSGKIAMVESSKHVKTWRDDIRAELAERLPSAAPLTGAVEVRLEFTMRRPKGHYRTGRNAHLLRDTAPPLPIGKPDIDKLTRAVLDAIGSAGVWVDDAQVTTVHASKRYGRRYAGVLIEIRPEEIEEAQ